MSAVVAPITATLQLWSTDAWFRNEPTHMLVGEDRHVAGCRSDDSDGLVLRPGDHELVGRELRRDCLHAVELGERVGVVDRERGRGAEAPTGGAGSG